MANERETERTDGRATKLADERADGQVNDRADEQGPTIERQFVLKEIEALIDDWTFPGNRSEVPDNVVAVLINLGMVVLAGPGGKTGSNVCAEWAERMEAHYDEGCRC